MEGNDKHIERAKAFADAWRRIADVVENNPDPAFLAAMDYGLGTITAPVGSSEGARGRILAAARAFQVAGFDVREYPATDDVHGGVGITVGPVTISVYASRAALADTASPLLAGAVES